MIMAVRTGNTRNANAVANYPNNCSRREGERRFMLLTEI
jgi:hypothetical protein